MTRLTKPATRLLLELIQKNRISITRKDLLEKVWVTYGYAASNAGLNNYISELRKAFALLGFNHELIITLPKLGFRLEADIDLPDTVITAPETGTIAEGNILVNNAIDIAETTPIEQPTAKNVASSQRKVLFVLMGFMVIFVIVGIMILNATHQKNYDYQKISSIDQCNLYILNKTPLVNDFVEKIRATLKRENVDCKNIPSDVFYLEDRISKDTVRADLISVCSKADSDRYDTCFNIKSQRNISK